MTTVCYIAQNVIWSNNVFLANCLKMACFLFSQCPYTYRMVETLSLYLLIVHNEDRKIFISQMKCTFMKHRELLEFFTYLPYSWRYKHLLLQKWKSDTLYYASFLLLHISTSENTSIQCQNIFGIWEKVSGSVCSLYTPQWSLCVV